MVAWNDDSPYWERKEDCAIETGETGTIDDYGDWFNQGPVLAELHDALNELQGALDERYLLLREMAMLFGTAA